MSDQIILLTGVAITIVGLYYWFSEKSWSPHSNHSKFKHEIHVVKCPQHCNWILQKMLESKPSCLGYYCEWNQNKPVLLALADPHGICVLIRLQELNGFPEALINILRSRNILKGGIDVFENSNVLITGGQSLEVHGLLDVRHIYPTRPNDLKSIAIRNLEISVENNHHERSMSNLTDAKIEYCTSKVIACAKLLHLYYLTLGPMESFIGKKYFSPFHTELGYDFHHVTTADHCEWIVSKLIGDIWKEKKRTKCVGFKCTWITGSVELLQIAGPKEICAIINRNQLEFIPTALIRFLNDQSTCKAGVGGANLLKKDPLWNIKSVLDLRHLYPNKPNGIEALCRRELELEDFRLSSWKHREYFFDSTNTAQPQLISLGLEAIASVKLFYHYLEKIEFPLRMADALGDYNFELSEKAAYRNDIPFYINKEYVERTPPRNTLLHATHRIFNNDIYIVSSPEHCSLVITKLQEDTRNNSHIGFDYHNNILQLASDNGICALILLNYFKDIPLKLRELLTNTTVTKCTFDGISKVKCFEASYFFKINSLCNPFCSDDSEQNLVTVAKRVLGVDLGEAVLVRSGYELSSEECQYCAGNVIAYAKMTNGPHIYEQDFKFACAYTYYRCQDTIHRVFGHTIYDVKTTERCRFVIKKLREVTKDCPYVGFDCEWPPGMDWYSRSPITMLQLAGGKGSNRLCALIRLCFNFEIPQELTDFLNDPSIVKAGVASIRDAQFLAEDYGFIVQGAIDLRFLYPQSSPQQPNGLAALAERELHVYLSKDKSITLSGFNQSFLSYDQIQYAAGDAIVGANLFNKYWLKCKKSMLQIKPLLDKPYTYVTTHSQPAPPMAQSHGHHEFESRVPPTWAFEHPGTENMQQHPVGSRENRRSKRRPRNKKR